MSKYYNQPVLAIDGNQWHLSEGHGDLMNGPHHFARTIGEIRAHLAKHNQVLGFEYMPDDLTPEQYQKTNLITNQQPKETTMTFRKSDTIENEIKAELGEAGPGPVRSAVADSAVTVITHPEELREAARELVQGDTETKNEKFIRLADQRTNKAIEYIRLVANLSNKTAYEYSPEQVEKIFQAIGGELAIMREILRGEFAEKKFSLRG